VVARVRRPRAQRHLVRLAGLELFVGPRPLDELPVAVDLDGERARRGVVLPVRRLGRVRHRNAGMELLAVDHVLAGHRRDLVDGDVRLRALGDLVRCEPRVANNAWSLGGLCRLQRVRGPPIAGVEGLLLGLQPRRRLRLRQRGPCERVGTVHRGPQRDLLYRPDVRPHLGHGGRAGRSRRHEGPDQHRWRIELDHARALGSELGRAVWVGGRADRPRQLHGPDSRSAVPLRLPERAVERRPRVARGRRDRHLRGPHGRR
jgi:hypothetical protein